MFSNIAYDICDVLNYFLNSRSADMASSHMTYVISLIICFSRSADMASSHMAYAIYKDIAYAICHIFYFFKINLK